MNNRGASWQRLTRFLLLPELPWLLALLGTLVLVPTLFIGFHLDDYVHRYLFSGLPGSSELQNAYQSPFGIANGDPSSNQWQIETGYAPWWTYPRLLISLWRPLSELTHRFDAALFPSSALLQHAHSLLWHFALVAIVAYLYRSVMGTTVIAGLAGLLYAIDHTHGFATGWIANRNALVAASFGAAALLLHVRGRTRGGRGATLLAAALFACALLAGEGAIAIFGYLLGYALFVDERSVRRRVLSLGPYALVIVGWRVAYSALGRGAVFSGLYLDPVREPLRFLLAVLERAPLLLLGEIGLPPAETYHFVPAPLAHGVWLLAVLVAVFLLWSTLPLLIADRNARFWSFGMLLALPPACTTHANNRLLFFVGIGAMALLAQLFDLFVLGPSSAARPGLGIGARRAFALLSTGFHLLISPFILPLSACGILLTSQAELAVESARVQGEGRDLVIVSSPDYFYVKLLPVLAALQGRKPPHRLRALSFGAVPLRITRPDAQTLKLQYQGGLLAAPLLELYRSRELPMPKGTRVRLQGLEIEVTAVTADVRAAEARFRFDAPLEDAHFAFVYWAGSGYRHFSPPAVGQSVELPPARLSFGL
jgi:hypothetical protein